MFGKDSNATKTKWLKKALTSVNNIAKKNVSIASLAKEFIKKKIFAPLKKAFENSTIYKIYKTYKEIGFKAFYKLAEYLDVSLKAVYKAFQKMGVTETQIKKIYSPLMKMLKRDVDICNCAALAVAGCLGIKTNLAALQNLAADIALNTDELVEYFSKEKEIIGTNVDAYEKVLQKNGYYNMVTYGNLTTEDLMSGLKVGEKAILSVECFDGEGHAIAIKKLEKGFAVYDAYVDYADNPKDGIRIYSNEEFKKMLSGKKVKVTGTDLKGKKKTMTVYFKSIEYYSTVTTDSKSIAEIVAKNGYSYIYEW